jgi:hypothetical protein
VPWCCHMHQLPPIHQPHGGAATRTEYRFLAPKPELDLSFHRLLSVLAFLSLVGSWTDQGSEVLLRFRRASRYVHYGGGQAFFGSLHHNIAA